MAEEGRGVIAGNWRKRYRRIVLSASRAEVESQRCSLIRDSTFDLRSRVTHEKLMSARRGLLTGIAWWNLVVAAWRTGRINRGIWVGRLCARNQRANGKTLSARHHHGDEKPRSQIATLHTSLVENSTAPIVDANNRFDVAEAGAGPGTIQTLVMTRTVILFRSRSATALFRSDFQSSQGMGLLLA
jgi:hypothetical protein